ncbi:uncharacterized protein LOC143055940 [Mytilus galloprovincialis]|uniref:uncharacterized protein LOC143055940 n=1 Tax=Mytilus galloprovincialis TaxID=29158 RepID=UPI003F7B9E37
MFVYGVKVFSFLGFAVTTLLISVTDGQPGLPPWQGGSMNAIPDADGNWQYVGEPNGQDDSQPTEPFTGDKVPIRLNSPMPQGGRRPRPMRLNGVGAVNTGETGFDNQHSPGRNPQNLNNRFGDSKSNMTQFMRGVMRKGKGVMNKIMQAIKSGNNSSVFISRQSRQFLPSACTQEMLQIQTDCFSKNGYTMDSFFHTLRNGSFSDTKQSSSLDGIKEQLCKKRQGILDCAIPAIIGKRDKPPCLDVHDYNFGQEMALKGLRIVQDVCETGLLPPSPICVPLVNREMQRCYTKVGFSPDMFISDDKDVEGAVIGKDMDAAQKFCGSRKQLYDCMRLVMKNCPQAEEYLMMSGHDQTAIEKSIDVLCDNKKVYVDGLNCFQTPSETVHNCIDVMSSQTLDLEARQMWKSMGKDDFLKEFCRIRVQHMECDTTAWKESCHEVTVGLKNEFQCAMLPGICHNITEIDDILHNNVCRRQAFLQALRSSYGGASTPSSWVLSIALAVGLSLFFL